MEVMFYEGKEYPLAVKSMEIVRLQEAAEQAPSLTKAYEKMFAFNKAVLGRVAIEEIFGSSNIEKIDVNLITIIYNEIFMCYERRIAEIQRAHQEELFDTPVFDKLQQVCAAASNGAL